MNPRIKIKNIETPFKIHVKYEHGDADLTTKETFIYSTEKEFRKVSAFLYECFNFVPKSAYGNLGHFQPIPDRANNGHSRSNNVWVDLIEIGKKYELHEDEIYELIQEDAHYNNGYASLQGMKASVNDQEVVYVFKQALETNRITLPNIGDIIKVNVNNIPGNGPNLFGGGYKDYLPNSGIKDYYEQTFDAKVIDCVIDFLHDYDNKYYHEYTYFPYTLLLEATEDVLNDGRKTRKLVLGMNGYDPEFEVKFNKGKYDDLNFYEI
jgi:hypothetical protein